MSETLYAKDIGHSMTATDKFSRDPGLMLARPARGCMPCIMIPHGFHALVTYNGAEIEERRRDRERSYVWGSGCKCASCLTGISHLVTKQYVVFDAPVKGCKTKDNVTVQIDVSTVFRVMGDKPGEDNDLPRKFVHNVGPSGLEQQLKDALAEEIRKLARSVKHTEVYACRSGGAKLAAAMPAMERGGEGSVRDLADDVAGVGEKKDGEDGAGVEMTGTAAVEVAVDDPAYEKLYQPGQGEPATPQGQGVVAADARLPSEQDQVDLLGQLVTNEMQASLNRQFNPQGIEIADVTIQNVVLPDNIASQMENKAMVRSKQEYETQEQQFEMQAIRLKNELGKIKIRHSEEQEKCNVQGSRDTQLARDKFAELTAARERTIAEYEERTKAEVDKIVAECTEQTTKLRFEKEQVLQTLALEAEQEAKMLRATSDAQVTELKAETQFTIASKEGEAAKTMALAEEKSNKILLKAREIELTEKELAVYEALASNDEVTISDSAEKDVNMMLLADSVLASDSSENTEKGNLARLNMLRLATTAYGLTNTTYMPQALNTLPVKH